MTLSHGECNESIDLPQISEFANVEIWNGIGLDEACRTLIFSFL